MEGSAHLPLDVVQCIACFVRDARTVLSLLSLDKGIRSSLCITTDARAPTSHEDMREYFCFLLACRRFYWRMRFGLSAKRAESVADSDVAHLFQSNSFMLFRGYASPSYLSRLGRPVALPNAENDLFFFFREVLWVDNRTLAVNVVRDVLRSMWATNQTVGHVRLRFSAITRASFYACNLSLIRELVSSFSSLYPNQDYVGMSQLFRTELDVVTYTAPLPERSEKFLLRAGEYLRDYLWLRQERYIREQHVCDIARVTVHVDDVEFMVQTLFPYIREKCPAFGRTWLPACIMVGSERMYHAAYPALGMFGDFNREVHALSESWPGKPRPHTHAVDYVPRILRMLQESEQLQGYNMYLRYFTYQLFWFEHEDIIVHVLAKIHRYNIGTSEHVRATILSSTFGRFMSVRVFEAVCSFFPEPDSCAVFIKRVLSQCGELATLRHAVLRLVQQGSNLGDSVSSDVVYSAVMDGCGMDDDSLSSVPMLVHDIGRVVRYVCMSAQPNVHALRYAFRRLGLDYEQRDALYMSCFVEQMPSLLADVRLESLSLAAVSIVRTNMCSVERYAPLFYDVLCTSNMRFLQQHAPLFFDMMCARCRDISSMVSCYCVLRGRLDDQKKCVIASM